MSGTRVLRNAVSLMAGKLAGDAATFALFVVLSRRYGSEGIGQYSFAMALTGFFAVLADYGLTQYAVRRMSAATGPEDGIFGRVLTLRLLLAGLVVGLLFGVAPWMPLDAEGRRVFLVIGVYQVLYVVLEGVLAAFVARETMRAPALLEWSLRTTSAAAAIALSFAGQRLSVVLLALPVLTALHVALAFALVASSYGRPRFGATPVDLRCMLRDARPFALYLFLLPLSERVDVAALGLLLGATAAGTYNAAHRIVALLLYAGYYAGVALLPAVSRLHADRPEELHRLYRQAVRIVVLASVPAAAGLTLVAKPLVELVFGPAFGESASLLRLLAWLLPLHALRKVLESFLVGTGDAAGRSSAQARTAVLNVVGNLLLIPLLGIPGAAVATIASEATLVALLLHRLRPVTGASGVATPIRDAVVASAGIAALLPAVSRWPLAAVAVGGAAIYGATLALFTDVRANEGALLRGLIDRRRHGSAPTARTVEARTQPGALHAALVADKLGYDDRLHGAGRLVVELASALPLHGVDAVTIVLRATPAVAGSLAARHVDGLVLGRARFDPRTFGDLVRILRRRHCDVVHLHGLGASAFGRLAAWRLGIPAVVHIHDDYVGQGWGYPRWMYAIDRLLEPLTARCIAVSEAASRSAATVQGFPEAKLRVLWNPVDLSHFRPDGTTWPEALRAELRLPEGAQVVVSVTRFMPAKRVDRLIEAFARVARRRPDAVLVLIGDGPQRGELEALAHARGVAGRVRFAGHRDDVPRWLGHARVFALSSPNESFAIAALEAMACRVPVAAFSVGGLQEIVRDGREGLLAPPGDVDALATAIERLLADDGLRERLASGALARARGFGLDAYVGALVSEYHAVVDARHCVAVT